MDVATVEQAVNSARRAQVAWATTTFAQVYSLALIKTRCSWLFQRDAVLLTLLDFVVENQDAICRVAVRDTGPTHFAKLIRRLPRFSPSFQGKTMVDGAFGEILTTCEKIRWTVSEGQAALATEYRSVGPLTMHKVSYPLWLVFSSTIL